jgi:hypothetical protein
MKNFELWKTPYFMPKYQAFHANNKNVDSDTNMINVSIVIKVE